jgi:hypothetical protein
MTGMEPFMLAAAIGGAGAGAAGSLMQGGAQGAIANTNAQALRTQAGQERAASEQQAYQLRHKGDVLLSQERADLAASGGGMGGSGAEILADTAGRSKYNEEMALWEGEQKARGLEDQSVLTKFAGDQGRKASYLKAGSQILTGISGVAARGGFSGFGGGGDEIADSVTDVDSGDTINAYRPRRSRGTYVDY